MTRLELIAGTSAKFWEAEHRGKVLDVRWGRLGTKGQAKRHACASATEAKQLHDRLVAQKRAKGYRDPNGKAPVAAAAPAARDPELEAAIRADRDDPGPYEVYADWLQSQGNPLGELIMLQRALDKKPNAARGKRARQLVAQLGLPTRSSPPSAGGGGCGSGCGSRTTSTGWTTSSIRARSRTSCSAA